MKKKKGKNPATMFNNLLVTAYKIQNFCLAVQVNYTYVPKVGRKNAKYATATLHNEIVNLPNGLDYTKEKDLPKIQKVVDKAIHKTMETEFPETDRAIILGRRYGIFEDNTLSFPIGKDRKVMRPRKTRKE